MGAVKFGRSTIMANILIVEDEVDLAHLVSRWLERDKHSVEIIHHGDEAMVELRNNINKYGLLILDLMLPGRNGIDLCKMFRSQQGTAPILIITAKDSIDDKEIGFRVGADDYLTKPFHLKELSVRVEALLRRPVLVTKGQLTVRDINLDTGERKVTKSGRPIHLSPKEFSLLEFLMKHPGQVFSAEDLIESVWEPDSDAMNDTIRGHVNRLRKKLDDKDAPSLIVNVYGFGYKLDP